MPFALPFFHRTEGQHIHVDLVCGYAIGKALPIQRTVVNDQKRTPPAAFRRAFCHFVC